MSGFWAHASAIVDEPASIGDFCHVMPNAKIGAKCSLGQNVFVGSRAEIDNNCKIQNNVSVYDDVILRGDVFVDPSAVFTNVINPRAFVIRKDEYKKTIVEQGASIGATATVVCGYTVGAYAFAAASAVVAKDVTSYALVAGVPAKRIGWMCKCCVTLPDKQQKKITCKACSERYAVKGSGKKQRLEPLGATGS